MGYRGKMQKKHFLVMTAFSTRSVLVLLEHTGMGVCEWTHVFNLISESDVRFSQR
jgi:hypothetical protein